MKSFKFFLDIYTPIEGKPHHFQITTLGAEGLDVDDARAKIIGEVPAGHRIWLEFCDDVLKKPLPPEEEA